MLDSSAHTSKLTPAVFIDRDGTLNEPMIINGKAYSPRTLEDFRLVPRCAEAVALMKTLGYPLVVVTNQPDVARGIMTMENVKAMNDYVTNTLKLDAFYSCFDDTPGAECQKPRPGMFFQAAREMQLDLANSYMIGDRWKDTAAGRAAGVTTIQIRNKYKEAETVEPHHWADDLYHAAELLLQAEKARHNQK